MDNILQAKIKEIMGKYKSFLAEIEFKLDTNKYFKEVLCEDNLEDESGFNMLKETTEKLTFENLTREEIAKVVAEKLGVSVIELLSMPTETVDKFIEERKVILQNETIEKYCKELKDNMASAGMLKDPEKFDALEFLAKVIIYSNN